MVPRNDAPQAERRNCLVEEPATVVVGHRTQFRAVERRAK